MNIQELHKKAQYTAQNYLKLEKDLLQIIIEVDRKKVFRHFGYNSLYAYVHEALKLSPAVTYNFIKVARKSHEIPELEEEVVEGGLSISKAMKMTSVLTQENHKEWFRLAAESTHKTLEREVALASPKTPVMEKTTYIHPTQSIPEKVRLHRERPRVALQVGLSEELMFRLKQAQNLESQRLRKNVSIEETLQALVEFYLHRKDPVRKAKKQMMRGKLDSPSLKKNCSCEQLDTPSPSRNGSHDPLDNPQKRTVAKKNPESSQTIPTRSKSPTYIKPKRQPIPAHVLHQVYLRDGGQCQYRDTRGKRCPSKRFIEIHHQKPVSQGGSHDVENLMLLCSGHHKVMHLRHHT